MRILGLDPGEKRIGVAVTDPLGITAQGITVINNENTDEALEKIKEVCTEYAVERIVVGNPLNMNGTAGESSQKAFAFADQLRDYLKLPVELIDERLTSASAEKTLLSNNLSRAKRRAVKDKVAAILILEQYLSIKGSE